MSAFSFWTSSNFLAKVNSFSYCCIRQWFSVYQRFLNLSYLNYVIISRSSFLDVHRSFLNDWYYLSHVIMTVAQTVSSACRTYCLVRRYHGCFLVGHGRRLPKFYFSTCQIYWKVFEALGTVWIQEVLNFLLVWYYEGPLEPA